MAVLLFNYQDYSLEVKGPLNKPVRVKIMPVDAKRTMTGTLYSFVQKPKSGQPYEERFTIHTRIYDQDTLNNYLNFFNLAQGKKILYTDEDNVQWDVIIIDNALTLIEGSKAKWEVEITLQGTQRS